MNRHLFIVRFGETALKGKNKSYFEKKLVEKGIDLTDMNFQEHSGVGEYLKNLT